MSDDENDVLNGVKSPYVVYGFQKSIYSCEQANNQALKSVGLVIALGLTQIKDTRRSKHGLWVEGRFRLRSL